MSTTNNESEGHETKQSESGGHSQRRMYLLFVAMIVTSTTVMFILTYTNNFSIDHVRWSEERFYMALLDGDHHAELHVGDDVPKCEGQHRHYPCCPLCSVVRPWASPVHRC